MSTSIAEALAAVKLAAQTIQGTAKQAFAPMPPDQGGMGPPGGEPPPEIQELFGAVEQLMGSMEEIGGAVEQLMGVAEEVEGIKEELKDMQSQWTQISTQLQMISTFANGGNPFDSLGGTMGAPTSR